VIGGKRELRQSALNTPLPVVIRFDAKPKETRQGAQENWSQAISGVGCKVTPIAIVGPYGKQTKNFSTPRVGRQKVATRGRGKYSEISRTLGGAPRLCTRYAFAAAATIIDSGGLETPAQVTNISVGGCRLSTNARVSVGASVVIKIQVATDCFEVRANVVHRAEDSVGVMFHNESPESFLVLNKWIQQTSEPLRCG